MRLYLIDYPSRDIAYLQQHVTLYRHKAVIFTRARHDFDDQPPQLSCFQMSSVSLYVAVTTRYSGCALSMPVCAALQHRQGAAMIFHFIFATMPISRINFWFSRSLISADITAI